jgi:hypothetical protein
MRLTFFILSLFICTISSAQINTFSKVWDDFIPISGEPLELSDGTFLVTSGRSTAINFTVLGLAKFDSEGNYSEHNWLWDNQPALRTLRRILQVSPERFITTGTHNYQSLLFSQMWFTKWNLEMDTISTQTYFVENANHGVRSNELDFQNNVLISGHRTPNNNSSLSNGLITKMDTSGNLKWQRSYLNQYGQRLTFYKAIALDESAYLMMGISSDSTINNGLQLFKTDTAGNVLNEFFYRFFTPNPYPNLASSTRGSDLYVTEDNSIIVGGASSWYNPESMNFRNNKFMLKLNSDLELVWTVFINSSTNTDYFSITALNNKLYSLVRESYYDAELDVIINRIGVACFDMDGNLLWEKMSQPTDCQFSRIITTSDGALLITGVYTVDDIDLYTWIIKMDEYGCVESECDFLQLQEVEQPIQVQLYPNPASHMLYVEGNRPVHAKSELVVFNLMGQKLLDATFASGSDRLELDINNLPSGIYILHWSSNGKILTSKRFVKQ